MAFQVSCWLWASVTLLAPMTFDLFHLPMRVAKIKSIDAPGGKVPLQPRWVSLAGNVEHKGFTWNRDFTKEWEPWGHQTIHIEACLFNTLRAEKWLQSHGVWLSYQTTAYNLREEENFLVFQNVGHSRLMGNFQLGGSIESLNLSVCVLPHWQKWDNWT